MNECHDGAYPDYDIRERYPDDVLPMDDWPCRYWDDDDADEYNNAREEEVNPVDVNEGASIVVGSDEIIRISDDDDVIIESMPDIIEIVEVSNSAAGPSKQPKVCLELQKTQHEKKILLKEEPKRVLKRPYNLGDNCKLTGIESQGNEDIYYYSLKKKRKVKLECEGRNIVKIYEERPCGASTSRGNEDDEPDVVEVHNSRRQKGIGKKSKKTCQPNQRCEPSTSRGNEEEEDEEDEPDSRRQKGDGKKSDKTKRELKVKKARQQKGFGKKSCCRRKKSKKKTDVDVERVATNLSNNLQNLIRPDLRTTRLTLEVLAMTKRIFDNCARIWTPKSDRKKRFFPILPLIIPPLVGVTVLAAESAAHSGEIHCPRGYQKFGKNCIRKGCPNGYLEILDFDIFQGLRKLPKGGGAKTDL